MRQPIVLKIETLESPISVNNIQDIGMPPSAYFVAERNDKVKTVLVCTDVNEYMWIDTSCMNRWDSKKHGTIQSAIKDLLSKGWLVYKQDHV